MCGASLLLQALHTTALLFGSLIGQQLVSSITLGMALRYVQEALANPPGSKMFGFGVVAMLQFIDLGHSWPQFCMRVLQVSHASICLRYSIKLGPPSFPPSVSAPGHP